MNQKSTRLLFLVFAIVATFLIRDVPAQRAQRTGKIIQIDAEHRSFVVKTARGETRIRTTEETVYMRGDKKLTFEDLKVDDSVQVIGTREPDHVVAREVNWSTD